MKTLIHTPTNSLSDSLNFYSRLNFKVISKEKPTLVTDGQAIIEINTDRYARAGVKIFSDSWQETIGKLEKMTAILTIENGHLLSDPSGVWIYLMDNEFSLNVDLSKVAPSFLGNYAGLSLETTDFNKSVEIWKLIGFSQTSGTIEQGYISCTNEEGITVSIMPPNNCPHLFFNPSLTYFNGPGNLEIIATIRELEIPITEEITHFNNEGIVDNIIIRDPGGYGFFLFND